MVANVYHKASVGYEILDGLLPAYITVFTYLGVVYV